MEVSDQKEEISCVLCGSSDYEVLYTKGKFDLDLNLSVCNNCGLGYLNPRWSKERYQHFYIHEYDNYYRSEVKGEETDAAKYATIKVVAKRLNKHGLINPDASSILDVGSGMGWNLEYLQKHHYPSAKLFAIEPSEHCRENLGNLGVEIVSDDVDSNWDEGRSQKFDVIVMRHVLEHFMDPIAVLKKMAASLSDDGILYIAVPNSNFPGIPFAKHFVRVVHTYYFTPHSLTNFLAKAGLKVEVLVEKDPDNKHEIYLVARKAKSELSVHIDPAQKEKLKEVFKYFEDMENSKFKSLAWKVKRRLKI